ncbi:MAG TPA: energy transducer TonB [Gemmatimonadales bacterium]|nr:energy transducer TonB [Gemmatimonadales bacterium]
MRDLLIESGARATAHRPWLPSGLIAVVAHVVIVAGAVWATLDPARAVGSEQSPVVLTWPEETPRDPRGDARDAIPGPPEPVVDAPSLPPVGLPPIDPGGRIEPFLPVPGVAGTAPANESDAAVDWRSVEEPPALLAGPPPAYPELLRAAGIEGRVVFQVVIDTLGRAEPAARVVESANRGFDAAALAFVRGALFRPGRVRGRAVRVLIRLPIDFTLRGVR